MNRISIIMIAVLAPVLIIFVSGGEARANDCRKGCAHTKKACVRVERDFCKICKEACKLQDVDRSQCRRDCRHAYRLTRMICKRDSVACGLECVDLDDSCAGPCGIDARICALEVRATASACRGVCRSDARAGRADCKLTYPDPGDCLDLVGDAQGSCLDACGVAQAEGYAQCRDDFAGCFDDCPPGAEPPDGECNDVGPELVVEVKESYKPMGLAAATWNSGFVHLGHLCGDTIVVAEGDLNLAADPPGSVAFQGFVDNKKHNFTPLSPDPATGSIVPGATAEVTFSGLHYDETCNVYIGNSHFKAEVSVDKDLDGTLESTGYLGVNIHVEALADCP
ncbi:MAG: hypothetical protein ACE5D3_04170 [Candidatus Binatia bacterium]